MRTLLVILSLLIAIPTIAQEEKKVKKNFFKEFYNDFLKYGTIYAAGDIRNAYEN